jgi:chromosome segregation ATPase
MSELANVLHDPGGLSLGIAAIVALMIIIIAGMMRLLYMQVIRGLEEKLVSVSAFASDQRALMVDRIKGLEATLEQFVGRWETRASRFEEQMQSLMSSRSELTGQMQIMTRRLDVLDQTREQITLRLEKGFLAIESDLRALNTLRTDTQTRIEKLTANLEQQELKREQGVMRWEERFRGLENELQRIAHTRDDIRTLQGRLEAVEASMRALLDRQRGQVLAA